MDRTLMTVGRRVQLHPATDWWMRGARYGTILKILEHGDIAIVELDANGKRVRLSAGNLNPIEPADSARPTW